MSSELATLIGGALEIVGLGLVAVKLLLIQGSELDVHPLLRRLLLFLKLVKPRSVERAGTTRVGSSFTVRYAVEGSTPTSLEERVERLARGLEALEIRVADDRHDLTKQIAEVREYADEVRATSKHEARERDVSRRDLLRRTQRLEVAGWICFVVGVGFSVGGSL